MTCTKSVRVSALGPLTSSTHSAVPQQVNRPLVPSAQVCPVHHVELSWRDGAYLHFAIFPAQSQARTTIGAELGFHVEDVRATHERATQDPRPSCTSPEANRGDSPHAIETRMATSLPSRRDDAA